MSAGRWNNFQSPFGNVFLYHRTISYVTCRQKGRHVKGDRTYADPNKYDNDTNKTNERRFGY